jgi:hypothetical protein
VTPENAQALCAKLQAAIDPARSELGPDGWAFEGAVPRLLMGTHLPVVAFRNGEKTLCFIITPTDASSPAYKRTPHYDLVYFSEDVADEKQSEIYQRDRVFIDRFAAWLRRWDS